MDELVRGGLLTESSTNPSLVSLNPKAKDEWQRIVESTFKTYDAAVKYIQDGVGALLGQLSNEDLEQIELVFEDSLIHIVASLGDSAATIFTLDKKFATPSPSGLASKYGKMSLKVDKPELRDAIQATLRNTFSAPPESVSKVLSWTANTYLLTKVLNMDPECRSLERDMFSKCTLYLDTNVLLACLLPSHPNHSQVSKLLRVCQTLRVDLRYTERTHLELMKVIDRSNYLYQKGLAKKAPNIAYHEHDVIKSFQQDYQNHGMSWTEYYLMLTKSERKLKNQFSVILDVTDYTPTVPPEEVEVLAPIVSQCSGGLHIKSPDVAAHDAFHIILVEKLRKTEKSAAFGAPWFLTLDYTLASVESFRSTIHGGIDYTSSITCDIWTDVLLPFMSPDVADENLNDAYASFVGSHFFPVARTISVGDLIRFIAPYLQDPYLNADDIAWILQHEHLQQVLRKAKAEDREPDTATLGRVVASLIDERKDAKLTEMDRQVQTLSAKLTETAANLRAENEREASELEAKYKSARDQESARLELMMRRVNFSNDMIVSAAIAIVVGVLAYFVWISTVNLGFVIGLVALGFVAGGAILRGLRAYRNLVRTSGAIGPGVSGVGSEQPRK